MNIELKVIIAAVLSALILSVLMMQIVAPDENRYYLGVMFNIKKELPAGYSVVRTKGGKYAAKRGDYFLSRGIRFNSIISISNEIYSDKFLFRDSTDAVFFCWMDQQIESREKTDYEIE